MEIENLNPLEARILGTLLEKSMATPDNYPMTLNSLRLACNQKSSRDPVSDYSDFEIEQGLFGLKRKCLVIFTPYGQKGQFKYAHFFEDARFRLPKTTLAIFAVLLLRQAQTLNEIKLRSASMHAFADLDSVETCLKSLAEGDSPLIALIPKRTGWKEARWRHNRYEETPSFENLEGKQDESGEHSVSRGFDVRTEIGSLRNEIAEIREELAALKRELGA